MTIYHRIQRWRGKDTTVEITHEEPRYEYTVTHLNGEVTKVEGNKDWRNEGFLLIAEKDDDTWARATVDVAEEYTGPPAFSWKRGYDVVRDLEGIQEIEKEKIGVDKWTFTVDRADGECEITPHPTEYYD